MAKNNSNKQQVNNANNGDRKGDTGRTSSRGQKQASGGSKNTNNQGRAKGV